MSFSVPEPLQMSTLVSLTGGLLVTFLLLVCGCVYAVRTEKCCFARKFVTFNHNNVKLLFPNNNLILTRKKDVFTYFLRKMSFV
jgi:hypothetical protein